MMGGNQGRFNRNFGATGAQWRGFSRKSEGILSFQATENRYTSWIVSFLPPAPCLLRAAATFGLLGLALVESPAQEAAKGATEPAPVVLNELPERFFQIQDDAGFLWQSLDNGALISGDTQYLQSGLNLIVDGEPFAPTTGAVRDPSLGAEKIDVRLDEKRAGLTISRDFWFDTRRSGVRLLDTFTNTGSSERTLSVVVRTTYPFAWQSLHGTGGGVLGTEPALELRPGDISLGVHFSPTEGRHDTFFLLGSEKGGQKPQLKASANLRELVFLYSVTIPAGQTRRLLHWVLQRNLPEVSQDLAAFAPFIQRGQWIDPGIPTEARDQFVNLAAESFVPEATSPARQRSLVALNELTESLGTRRRGEDLLWIGPATPLSGALAKSGEITIEVPFLGETTVPVANLAAVRGGDAPAWYLRDGSVLVGRATKGSLSWTVAGKTEPLAPAAFRLLLLGAAASDGETAPGVTHFLQLANGLVMPVAGETSTGLDWIGPWGREAKSWSELNEVSRRPLGGLPLAALLKDGSTHAIVWAGDSLAVKTGADKVLEVPVALIERIWRVNGAPLLGKELSSSWIDFVELPTGIGPAGGVLLRGDECFAGTLGDSALTLRDGATLVKVDAARIERLLRSAEPETPDQFTIFLNGGERLEGVLVDPYLHLRGSGGQTLEVPMSRVLAYRQAPRP